MILNAHFQTPRVIAGARVSDSVNFHEMQSAHHNEALVYTLFLMIVKRLSHSNHEHREVFSLPRPLLQNTRFVQF